MRLVDTAEGPTDPVAELVSAEQSLRLDYLAFAVDPLGLYRIEPGTLGRQKAGNYPYSSFATTIFDLAVVGGNPASTWRLLCQESLSQIKSRALLPLCWSFSQHYPRNCVVMALTGLPSTTLSQVSLSPGRYIL
jgi:hypothetical protein